MNQTKLFALVGLLLIASSLTLFVGAANMSAQQVFALLFSFSDSDFVIHQYRLPRMLLAIGVGAGLGLSGVLVQGVIRNPLASPDLMGISAGAGLAATACLVLYPNAPVAMLPMVAMAGGLLAAGFIAAGLLVETNTSTFGADWCCCQRIFSQRYRFSSDCAPYRNQHGDGMANRQFVGTKLATSAVYLECSIAATAIGVLVGMEVRCDGTGRRKRHYTWHETKTDPNSCADCCRAIGEHQCVCGRHDQLCWPACAASCAFAVWPQPQVVDSSRCNPWRFVGDLRRWFSERLTAAN